MRKLASVASEHSLPHLPVVLPAFFGFEPFENNIAEAKV